jgi:small subunit ribosomal protein S21
MVSMAKRHGLLQYETDILGVLKKKLQKEGVFREMKLKQHFEKPSEKNARQKAEVIRRARKLARKKLEREG